MSTPTISGPRPRAHAGSDGFGQLLHAEWTKFRTVRGWVIGMIIAAILTVFVGVFTQNGSIGCGTPSGAQKTGRACLPNVPLGPGGEAVTDSFSFVHQPLSGNGSITVRLTALTGRYIPGVVRAHPGQGPGAALQPGVVAWSKAGIIIKASTKQGSAYAAMMVAGGHGVRMQYDFTHDAAGLPGAVAPARPRWLRLVRSGDTITGYDSAGGTTWTQVGTARLAGLPATVQVGMFAASPGYTKVSTSFGGQHTQGGPSQATGRFDDVRVSAAPASRAWSGTAIGGGGPVAGGPGFRRSGGAFTVTGSGDIAPLVPGAGSSIPTTTIGQSLAGLFIGLIAIVAVAAMFFSVEYRRGLIRTTLTATPGRGRVLAAKALIAGGAAFAVALAASVASITLGVPRAESQGQFLLPVSVLTEVRVVAGTAAMVGLYAILAVAMGAIMRRSALAITAVIVAVILPFLFATLNVFPSGVSDWLLRVTPAAGLSIEQSIPHYPQIASVFSPVQGFYALGPWAGLAVLCVWVAAALALALVLLRRRDA